MKLKEKFENGKVAHTFQRIDPSFNSEIYIGYNQYGNMSLVIIEDGNPIKVKSSNIIDVRFGRRKDKRITLSFTLLDQSFESMFLVFCEDIIKICESTDSSWRLSNAVHRWKYWREMFGKKKRAILTKEEIKGLIGELHFLQTVFFKSYKVEDSIKSWMGPVLGHKDFEVSDTWYEIKAIAEGASSVTISSIEQLDSMEIGHLVVVRMEDTSPTSSLAINLNSIVASVRKKIKDVDILNEFDLKLNDVGYAYSEAYEDYNFVIKGYDQYVVDERFPRIKREDISDVIENVKYSLVLYGIRGFKEG